MKIFCKAYSLLLLIFIINFNLVYGELLGEKYFNSKVEFYFKSNNISMENISDKNIIEKFEIIKEYDYYKDIELLKHLKNKTYSMAFNEDKKKSFCIIIKMEISEYLNSSFYKNKNFEEETIQGVSTYYFLGEKEIIYTYIESELYLSNNISMFFEIMNNVSYAKDNLADFKNFNTIKPDSNNFEYFYYKKEENNIKNYISKAFSIKKDIKGMEKLYYIPDLNYIETEKKYNFSDFIPNKINEIYYGKDFEIISKSLVEKFDFITGNQILKNSKINENIDLLYDEIVVKVKNEENKEYFIVYFKKDIFNIINKIKTIYEKELFYEKKLEYVKEENEENLYSFKIPLFDKKVYMGVLKENYIIVTEDKKIYEDLKVGKYYNFKYVNISNKEEYYENFINGSKKYSEKGKNYIKEIF